MVFLITSSGKVYLVKDFVFNVTCFIHMGSYAKCMNNNDNKGHLCVKFIVRLSDWPIGFIVSLNAKFDDAYWLERI